MIDIVLDTIIDAAKIVPFIFVAFLLIESLEHRLTKTNEKLISTNKKAGPLFGGILGLIPQCGFSVLATDLYITRIITLGTLISIYLATSDEMLIILISEKVAFDIIIKVLLVKVAVGILIGYLIDLVFRKKVKEAKHIDHFDICDDEHCHCDEEGILLASLKHTTKIVLFIMAVTFVVNIIMEYMGNNFIENIFMKDTLFSPFISSLVGLIPSCGSSVILTELFINKAISFSSMIAGLLTNSGVALIVLFKSNKNMKENFKIVAILYLIGAITGLIFHIIGI